MSSTVFVLLFCDKENKYFVSIKVKKNVKCDRLVLFIIILSQLIKKMFIPNKYNTFTSGQVFFLVLVGGGGCM